MAQERKNPTSDTADSSKKRARSRASEQDRPPAKGSDKDAQDDEEDDDEEDDDEKDDDERDDDEDDELRSDARSRSVSPWRFSLRTWLLLGGAVALVGYLVIDNQSETKTEARPEPGAVVDASLTLVAADRKDLDCMATKGVAGFKCGFVNEKAESTVDERHRLRPFLTLDRTLTLIPGLFLEPALEARSKTEPPDKPREQLKRFTAKCKVKIVGEMDGVRLRWRPEASWEPRMDDVRVGTVSGCRIQG